MRVGSRKVEISHPPAVSESRGMEHSIVAVHDVVKLAVSTAGVFVALAILVWTLRSATFFQEGLLAKTMHRLAVVATLLFVHFLATSLIELGVLSGSTIVDDVSGILFMLALWYTVYGFAKDWRSLEEHRL